MNTQTDFEQWAEQQGLSTITEAASYAYMGWEARQKEIDALKAKLEEFILCMKGTEEKYGLLYRINTYYYNSDIHEKVEELIEETISLLESKSRES